MAAVHSAPAPSSAMRRAEAPGQMHVSAPPSLPADHCSALSTVSRFPGPRFDCMEVEMQRQISRGANSRASGSHRFRGARGMRSPGRHQATAERDTCAAGRAGIFEFAQWDRPAARRMRWPPPACASLEPRFHALIGNDSRKQHDRAESGAGTAGRSLRKAVRTHFTHAAFSATFKPIEAAPSPREAERPPVFPLRNTRTPSADSMGA